MNDVKLTLKQRAFCDYYIECGNATEAARKAGYSAKTAKVIGAENLTKPYLKRYINERMKEVESKRIASAEEILQFLTSAVRDELVEEVVVVEGMGEGVSSATTIEKKLSAKDRIKAAELIGKRYAIFTERQDVNVTAAVSFEGEDELED